MFVLRPDLEAEDNEEVLTGLTGAIVKNGGTVDRLVDWRKRRLAYEIEKHTEGHYFLLYFSGPGTIIPELEHFFRVSDAIIRFMVVRVEAEDYDAAVAAGEEEALEAEAVEEAAEAGETEEAAETGEAVEAAGAEEAEEAGETAVPAEAEESAAPASEAAEADRTEQEKTEPEEAAVPEEPSSEEAGKK